MALSLRIQLVAAALSVVAKSATIIDPTTSTSTNGRGFDIDAVKLNAQPSDAVEVATVGLTTVTIFASVDTSALVLTADSTSSTAPAEMLSSISLSSIAPTIANVTASPVPTAPSNTTTLDISAGNNTATRGGPPTPLSYPAPTPVNSDEAPKPKPDDSKPDSPDNKKSGAGQLASSLKQDLLATILVGVLFSPAM